MKEIETQGLVADLRETCPSRWSDTVTACDEQRAEAADAIEELERAVKLYQAVAETVPELQRERDELRSVKTYTGDVAGTTEQFRQWVRDELKDAKKAAELKSRSDEADAKMAARSTDPELARYQDARTVRSATPETTEGE